MKISWHNCTVPPESTPAQRVRVAIDLYEEAELLMRQNLRRRHPDATDAEIEKRLGAWLVERPGAELGDGPGRPTERFRAAS